MAFLKEGDPVACVEGKIKNKWRWQWLNETDDDGNEYRKWCKKINVTGTCFCIVCSKTISYGANGKKKLRSHADHPEHKKNMKVRSGCETLNWKISESDQPSVGGPSTSFRIEATKTKLLAFMAEHQLPFSVATPLLDLCNDLAKDKKALQKTHMSRTAATYTTTHGLAAALKNDLRQKLSSTHYSLNIDEATNNAMNKIVNILVRYFDDDGGEVKTVHFASTVVNQATSQNIFDAVIDALRDDPDTAENPVDVPVKNMVSCLMDNCATMRGNRAGVETLLRAENEHLLDIAGDTVHTVSNAAKTLFKPFDGYLENICSDIYYDLEKSPKAKDLFEELQILMQIVDASKNSEGTLHIIRPCPSRFLQMLQVTERLATLMDVCRLYYFAFLTPEEQKSYRNVMTEILNKYGLSKEAAARVKLIQMNQAKQFKSSCNQTRKDRLLTALFKEFNKFSVLVNMYRGLLKKFEMYTKMLQSEKPLVHMQHEMMFSVVRKVLELFIKRNHVPDNSVKKIVSLTKNVRDKDFQVQDRNLCVGEYAYFAFRKALKDPKCKYWARDIAKKLRKGYENTAAMLLQNLPLTNKTLLRLSCLHPKAYADETTAAAVRDLAVSLPNVIAESQLGQLDSEVRDYTLDRTVQQLADAYDDDTCRLDTNFWSQVVQLKRGGSDRYPLLSRLVKALLSVFSGPLVESSFNTMDDCIRADRTRLSVENYEATAVIRSVLKARKITATALPITQKTARYIRTSKVRYSKHLISKRKKQKARQDQRLKDAVQHLCSRKSKELLSKAKSGKRTVRCTPSANTEETSVRSAACTASVSVDETENVPTVSSTSSLFPAAAPPVNISTSVCPSVPCHVQSASSAAPLSPVPGSSRKRKAGTADIRQFFKRPLLD